MTILAGAMPAAKPATRIAYHHEGSAPPEFFEARERTAHPSRLYRNPIALARDWQGLLASGAWATPADLARHLGVSRARVSQVLGLLALAPEFAQALYALGDPLPTPVVTERKLRPILKLPPGEQ